MGTGNGKRQGNGGDSANDYAPLVDIFAPADNVPNGNTKDDNFKIATTVPAEDSGDKNGDDPTQAGRGSKKLIPPSALLLAKGGKVGAGAVPVFKIAIAFAKETLWKNQVGRRSTVVTLLYSGYFFLRFGCLDRVFRLCCFLTVVSASTASLPSTTCNL